MEIVGLILTAGYSSRMGTFKPLLQIGDTTAVEMVAATLKKAEISNVIGITGFQRERLHPIFAREGILEAYNQNFEQGMFTSIQKGISEALLRSPAAPEGFFLMLVDCPLIRPEVLRLILKKHEEEPDAFIVPCYRGKKGHPLFIPYCYAEEILSYKGEGGLKAITNRHEDRLIRLETGTESVVLDMDTPEGYQEVLEYFQKSSGAERAALEGHGAECGFSFGRQLQGKRLFFIRHGEIRQHKEKIFLGQTDVPLSDKGKKQAEDAAAELMKHQVKVKRIYTSDLSRAAETAEIIGKHLNQANQYCSAVQLVREPRLREMSLGEWDGQFIHEIQRKYPEEYQKRGENLLTYKFGNDSENFYDLQYRALKAFQSILKREAEEKTEGRDILIVSHRGVISTILSCLNGTELEEEIKKTVTNGGIIVMDFT